MKSYSEQIFSLSADEFTILKWFSKNYREMPISAGQIDPYNTIKPSTYYICMKLAKKGLLKHIRYGGFQYVPEIQYYINRDS